VYGSDQAGIIGGLDYIFLINVPYNQCTKWAPTVPAGAFAMFEMMFAAITPLLLTGAFAERLRWKAYFLFLILWEVLVFYPVAHWIWGGGWLYKLGALDFAGGIVIHTTAGTGALVSALILGRRQGFDRYHGEFPPSNMPLATIGAAFLWMGWFGFNAGSALSSGPLAVSAVVSTQVAGAMSGFTWMMLSWWQRKPSILALINGVVAGLAGVTPASGYINTQWTLPLGMILGVASYFSVHFFKHKLRIDDALDVSSVHGLTGIIGSLWIGLACEQLVNPSVAHNGLFYGDHSAYLLGIQALAVTVAAAWSAFVTAALMLIMQRFIGLKLSVEQEELGVDATDHGEQAYASLLESEETGGNHH
jgi:Amt family ammonium transporter